MTLPIARDLGMMGVRVNTIAPGESVSSLKPYSLESTGWFESISV